MISSIKDLEEIFDDSSLTTVAVPLVSLACKKKRELRLMVHRVNYCHSTLDLDNKWPPLVSNLLTGHVPTHIFCCHLHNLFHRNAC